jgi:hypothetical protein
MNISIDSLTLLIYSALALTVLAPVVLLGLWLNDRNKDRLW